METSFLEEVIDCLTDERRLVHYYNGQYALYLLQKYCERHGDTPIARIRNANLAKLLQRPDIKALVARFGDGKLTTSRLEESPGLGYQDNLTGTCLSNHYQSYLITLSKWGCKEDYDWVQTSRPGSNLVMQLNLTNQHDQYLLDLKMDASPFKYSSHPIHETKSSLAWARIDFDFDTGEALIEEIQNDWLRLAVKHSKWASNTLRLGKHYYYVCGERYIASRMAEYTADLFSRHQKRWQETTLFYAIQLIKEEIGISRIFFHSVETGATLKNIRRTQPPRSLYSDLPKRFCFNVCKDGPKFIVNNRKIRKKMKKLKHAKWFRLDL